MIKPPVVLPPMYECDFCTVLSPLRDMVRLTLDAVRPKGSLLVCESCYYELRDAAPQIEEIAVDAR